MVAIPAFTGLNGNKEVSPLAGRFTANSCHKTGYVWMVAIALACAPAAVRAQTPIQTVTAQPLPSAPEPLVPSTAAAPGDGAAIGTGEISGTVLNRAGAEVPAARVILKSTGDAEKRVVTANKDGEFTFSGLPAGTYTVTASGTDWGTYVSQPIHLAPGGFQILTGVVLPVVSTSSVQVFASPDALAEEQVHIAEQQRVLAVFPNFYSSYDWNAPAMHSKQKYQLALRSLIDPLTFLGAGVVAGLNQYGNRFPGYGPGAEGYLKRYGAAFADAWSGRMISNAVYPSIFHQDPRFFYRSSGSFESRAVYAIGAAVIARGDDGHWEPSYSHILGSFTAAAVSNLYYPAANRGGSLVLTNGLIGIAADAGSNLLREFVVDKLTTRARAKH